uniref:Uncharacterized protein n=1 Tax=Arundo donax TaxID=35708 RepID=A0A0A9AGF6_ARUDO
MTLELLAEESVHNSVRWSLEVTCLHSSTCQILCISI